MFDACNIYPHQAWTNANDKMTVKDYIFLQNIMHRQKYSNVTVQSGGSQQKSAAWRAAMAVARCSRGGHRPSQIVDSSPSFRLNRCRKLRLLQGLLQPIGQTMTLTIHLLTTSLQIVQWRLEMMASIRTKCM